MPSHLQSTLQVKVCAIIAVRNAADTLRKVLEHLSINEIDVIVIDNQSSDQTMDIAYDFFGSSVISIVSLRYDGVYRWQRLLELKESIADELEHDWIIHQDGDEILEAPTDESLRCFIERLNRDQVDIIDCDEFVFLPAEGSDHYVNFFESMQHYYFHSPQGRKLHRLQRRQSGKRGWARTGGHELDSNGRVVGKEKVRLRHYIGLSYDSLRMQYLSRVFDAAELRKGWHVKRVATSPFFIREVPLSELKTLNVQPWGIDLPLSRHPIFDQSKSYLPPPERDGCLSSERLIIFLTSGSVRASPVISLFANLQQCEYFYCEEVDLNSGFVEQIKRHLAKKAEKLIFVEFSARFAARLAKEFPGAYYVHILNNEVFNSDDSNREVYSRSSKIPQRIWNWIWGMREIRQAGEFLAHYHEIKIEDFRRDPASVVAGLAEYVGLDMTQLEHVPSGSICPESQYSTYSRAVLSVSQEGAVLLRPLLRDLGY